MATRLADNFVTGSQALEYTITGTVARGTATPRVAGGTYAQLSSGATMKRAFTAAAEIFDAMAFYCSDTIAGGGFSVSYFGDSGATRHITIMRNTSGFMEARLGTTAGTLLATGTTFIPPGTWPQIENRLVISDTVGVVQVRINGNTTPDISFSGDTKNGGTNVSFDARQFNAYNADLLVTDTWLRDTTGARNITWAGDCSLLTISPSSDGSHSDFTPSTGTAHFSLYDDLPWNTSDVGSDSTSGHIDSVNLSDLAAGVTPLAAILKIYAAKSDPGAANIQTYLLSGGTAATGTSSVLGTSFGVFETIYDSDPNGTIAWTRTAINAVEAGAKVP